MKRGLLRESGGHCTVRKSNVMLIGGTGCGKTLLARCIADYMKVPLHIQDCTKLTASGYAGSDVEECLAGLLRASGYDIAAAQHGIVVLDEIDKNAVRQAGPSGTRDVGGECVQQSLLKIIEGDIVGVPPAGGRKHPDQQLLYVDTSGILFIATGAFPGLGDIVARREGAGGRIGFQNALSEGVGKTIPGPVTAQDLRDFGMIPELVSRFPVITCVDELSHEDLVRILTDPEGSLVSEYRDLLEMDGIRLSFEQDALDCIAEEAFGMGTGARALRSVMERIMRDVMFDAPDIPEEGQRTVTVTREMVKRILKRSVYTDDLLTEANGQ
jgi:ATP-dependent Clp protease ATP-binding subunit ClpX